MYFFAQSSTGGGSALGFGVLKDRKEAVSGLPPLYFYSNQSPAGKSNVASSASVELSCENRRRRGKLIESHFIVLFTVLD